MSGVVFTHGTWVAKPGFEDEFVAAWKALGDWTRTAFPEAHGTLLRDRDDPRRFVSFGPWPDAETAEAWRARPEFKAHVEQIQEALESFEPRLLDLVVESK